MTSAEKLALREIAELFDEAERKVKEVEQFSQELSVPSINELRYVGYPLARALSEEDANTANITDQLQKARGHCQRAIYDAHEVGIVHLLEQIREFSESYRKSSHIVAEVVPDYVDLLVRADQEKVFVVQNGEKNTDNRGAYYRDCAPHYAALKATVHKLVIASPLIDDKIAVAQRTEQRETRRLILGVLLTILAIMVAIAIGCHWQQHLLSHKTRTLRWNCTCFVSHFLQAIKLSISI